MCPFLPMPLMICLLYTSFYDIYILDQLHGNTLNRQTLYDALLATAKKRGTERHLAEAVDVYKRQLHGLRGRKEHALVLDLYAEARPHWETWAGGEFDQDVYKRQALCRGSPNFCRSQAAGIFRLRSIFYIPVGKAPFSFPLCSIWALCSVFF